MVEIGSVVLEKKIFKFRQFSFTVSLLSPLGKRRDPLFELTLMLFYQGCFVSSLVEFGSVVMERMKMWKFYEKMEDGQQAIR